MLKADNWRVAVVSDSLLLHCVNESLSFVSFAEGKWDFNSALKFIKTAMCPFHVCKT